MTPKDVDDAFAAAVNRENVAVGSPDMNERLD
jgi:hypothetical protein